MRIKCLSSNNISWFYRNKKSKNYNLSQTLDRNKIIWSKNQHEHWLELKSTALSDSGYYECKNNKKYTSDVSLLVVKGE